MEIINCYRLQMPCILLDLIGESLVFTSFESVEGFGILGLKFLGAYKLGDIIGYWLTTVRILYLIDGSVLV